MYLSERRAIISANLTQKTLAKPRRLISKPAYKLIHQFCVQHRIPDIDPGSILAHLSAMPELQEGHFLVSKGAKGGKLPRGTQVFYWQKPKFPTDKFRPIVYLKSKETRKWLSKVNDALQDITANDFQNGFRPKKSVITESNWWQYYYRYISIDLKSAFNQMSFYDAYWLARKVLKFPNREAAVIAGLLTDFNTGFAYQGSPITPFFFNLWTLPFMSEHIEGADFISYADDILICFKQKKHIEQKTIDRIHGLAKHWGITLNETKTHVFKRQEGRVILGLTVSPDVKSAHKRKYLKRIASEYDLILKTGGSPKECLHHYAAFCGYIGWLHAPKNSQSYRHKTVFKDVRIWRDIHRYIQQKALPLEYLERIMLAGKFLNPLKL